MKNNKFAGAIWTDHALDRIDSRKIPKDYAVRTFKNPDEQTKSDEGIRFVKKLEGKTITIVAKPNDRDEWVVLSIWMSPPAEGTEDARKKKRYKEYKKASLGKKIWLTILKQIGI